MNPERGGGGREGQRDDPWGMLSDEHAIKRKRSDGGVAKLERANGGAMEIASAFDGEDKSINPFRWMLWFRDKDELTAKDETYYRKVTQEIEAWNKVPLREREDFLNTGEYTDNITESMVSILTSGRIIALSHLDAGGGGGGGLEGGDDGDADDGNDDSAESGDGGDGPDRGDGVEGGNDGDGAGGGNVGGSNNPKVERPRARVYTGGSGEPIWGWDRRIRRPWPRGYDYGAGQPGTGSTGEVRDSFEGGQGDDSAQETAKRESGGENAEGPDDDTELEPDKEVYVLAIKEIIAYERVPAPEQLGLREKVKKRAARVAEIAEGVTMAVNEATDGAASKIVKGGAILSVAAMLLAPFLDKDIYPAQGYVDASAVDKMRTEYGAREIPGELTDEERERMRGEVADKLLGEVSLGDEIELPAGLILHSSSDYELVASLGGEDKTVTIGESSLREQGKYTVDRVSFLDESGKIVKSFHVENGDTGKISELLEAVQSGASGKLSISLHFDGPVDNGEGPSGQTGWSEGVDFLVDKDELERYLEDAKLDSIIRQAYSVERPVEREFRGESGDLTSGEIELQGDDGKMVTVNILNPDGGYRKRGDEVIGSDGKVYQIEDMSIQDGRIEYKLNLLRLMHDLGVLGLAGTGVVLAAKSDEKRRREKMDQWEARHGEGSTEERERVPTRLVEHVEERVKKELSGEQLIYLTKVFSKIAGDNAMGIASELAKEAEIEVPISNGASEAKENSAKESGTIFDQMNDAEMLVAQALLTQHDGVTLKRLSELLHTDLNDLIRAIDNYAPEGDAGRI